MVYSLNRSDEKNIDFQNSLIEEVIFKVKY